MVSDTLQILSILEAAEVCNLGSENEEKAYPLKTLETVVEKVLSIFSEVISNFESLIICVLNLRHFEGV